MAFILGVLPLVFATGAGAMARRTIGFTVLGGMLAASSIAIFIVPVLFVIITRLSYGREKLAYLQAHHEELMEKARRVEQQNIDPELEYEICTDPASPKPYPGMIANTFIKRPVTAIVMSVILMISGIICIANLAVDQYPNITPPAVSISRTVYRRGRSDRGTNRGHSD